MKIEVGKRYFDRSGKVHTIFDFSKGRFRDGADDWNEDGRYSVHNETNMDLMEEYPRNKLGPDPVRSAMLDAENAEKLEEIIDHAIARTTLSDGTQVYPEHKNIVPETGMQKGYVVLAEEERAKGFVRPYRDSYIHEKCGCLTKMGRTIAETYARDPYFYGGTFCVSCGGHFPVGPKGEFVWDGTNVKVGT